MQLNSLAVLATAISLVIVFLAFMVGSIIMSITEFSYDTQVSTSSVVSPRREPKVDPRPAAPVNRGNLQLGRDIYESASSEDGAE